jgi:hypothetical protein
MRLSKAFQRNFTHLTTVPLTREKRVEVKEVRNEMPKVSV